MHVFDTAIGRAGVEWDEAGITEVLMPGRSGLVDDGRELPPAVRAGVAGIVALLAGERRDLREIVARRPRARRLPPPRLRRHARHRPGRDGHLRRDRPRDRRPGRRARRRRRLGSNPFPIIVPCHRVLAADGALHGFSAPGGLATKRRMLEIECAPGFTQESLFA